MRKQFEHDPEAVTAARKAAGLSKTALARKLDCSLSLISEIEGGTRNLRRPLRVRMARVLKVRIADLEPGGTAATPADVDVHDVRGGERAEPEDLQELRGLTAHSDQAGGGR